MFFDRGTTVLVTICTRVSTKNFNFTISCRCQVGDQIIEINGYNTTNMTHAEAISLISSGGSTVRLLVKRIGKAGTGAGRLTAISGGGWVGGGRYGVSVILSSNQLLYVTPVKVLIWTVNAFSTFL